MPIVIFVTAFVLILSIILGIKIYTKNNYDIKIITDDGKSFFIFETSFKEYYLVNSKLGTKVKTGSFEISEELLSEDTVQLLKDIEQKDCMFSASKNCSRFFIYENNIYYDRCRNYDDNHQIVEGALSSIYKYDIKAKEITVFLKSDNNLPIGDIKIAVLKHYFPDFKSAISNKCKNGFSCEASYFHDGRIFFVTCRSTSAKGTTSYLYEYLPKSNQTNKIAKFYSGIVGIDFVK